MSMYHHNVWDNLKQIILLMTLWQGKFGTHKPKSFFSYDILYITTNVYQLKNIIIQLI